MKRRETYPQDDLVKDDYLTLSEVAQNFGVSLSVIRRKVGEGNMFPGAKKVPAPWTGAGAMWVIPRSEATSVSLQELAPRTYKRRLVHKREPYDQDKDGSTSPTTRSALEARMSALEDRMSVVERHLIRLFDHIDGHS